MQQLLLLQIFQISIFSGKTQHTIYRVFQLFLESISTCVPYNGPRKTCNSFDNNMSAFKYYYFKLGNYYPKLNHTSNDNHLFLLRDYHSFHPASGYNWCGQYIPSWRLWSSCMTNMTWAFAHWITQCETLQYGNYRKKMRPYCCTWPQRCLYIENKMSILKSLYWHTVSSFVKLIHVLPLLQQFYCYYKYIFFKYNII